MRPGSRHTASAHAPRWADLLRKKDVPLPALCKGSNVLRSAPAKITKNDALAGNTQIEDSIVLQGLAVHTRSEGKVETMFTAAGGTAALSGANRSYMLANGYQMFLEFDDWITL